MSRRILVVDDDETTRLLVKGILEQDGYMVDEASDGGEALERIRGNGSYNAIVLDLMMVRVSGFDVVKTLASERPDAKNVVIISAASESQIESARLPVVQTTLRKPFDIQELRDAISRCCD